MSLVVAWSNWVSDSRLGRYYGVQTMPFYIYADCTLSVVA